MKRYPIVVAYFLVQKWKTFLTVFPGVGEYNKHMKKILIVEDESLQRDILWEKFIREGFEAIIAKNGDEGLKQALLEKPDLILLDIVMPVMDGMTMLKKLREDEWGKKVKVLVLTNLSDAEKTAEALNRGAYDFLVKTNWTLDDVVGKVKEALIT